jgi:predicted nucleotidyltransferase
MNGTDQIKDLFDRFKELYPNSTEPFDPSLDNLRRWRWSIQEAELRQSVEYDKFTVDPNLQVSARKLAKSRAVGVFGRLPQYARIKFETLASLFPGRKVYATGSRVTGEYVDQTSGIKVRRMREALLKKDVVESDYDIIVEPMAPGEIDDFRSRLPSWADLVVNPLPDDPKIIIPMWDFTKLPTEKHEEVYGLIQRRAWGQLMAIHNEFGLSAEFYCCQTDAVRSWFTWAVEQEIIKPAKNESNDDQS